MSDGEGTGLARGTMVRKAEVERRAKLLNARTKEGPVLSQRGEAKLHVLSGWEAGECCSAWLVELAGAQYLSTYLMYMTYIGK